MYTPVDLSKSRFVGFTLERLEAYNVIFSQIIQDEKALGVEIETTGRELREIMECIGVFEYFDVEDENATVADIIEAVSEEDIREFQKKDTIGMSFEDVMSKTKVATEVSVKYAKKGLNVFGKWLANNTDK